MNCKHYRTIAHKNSLDPSKFKAWVFAKAAIFHQVNILYSELIMRRALEKWEVGIEIGVKYCNNLRYIADDVALLAMTDGNLQQLTHLSALVYNLIPRSSHGYWPTHI